jgi:hypothetical protein
LTFASEPWMDPVCGAGYGQNKQADPINRTLWMHAGATRVQETFTGKAAYSIPSYSLWVGGMILTWCRAVLNVTRWFREGTHPHTGDGLYESECLLVIGACSVAA